jgi:hypothetical protein
VRRDRAVLPIALVGLATLAFHLATNGRYGFFPDQLSFLMFREPLPWSYVDHPPLAAVMAGLATALFDQLLVGLRVIPALATTGLVVLTGAFVLRLGGGMAAAVLATVAVAAAPLAVPVLPMETFLHCRARPGLQLPVEEPGLPVSDPVEHQGHRGD